MASMVSAPETLQGASFNGLTPLSLSLRGQQTSDNWGQPLCKGHLLGQPLYREHPSLKGQYLYTCHTIQFQKEVLLQLQCPVLKRGVYTQEVTSTEGHLYISHSHYVMDHRATFRKVSQHCTTCSASSVRGSSTGY